MMIRADRRHTIRASGSTVNKCAASFGPCRANSLVALSGSCHLQRAIRSGLGFLLLEASSITGATSADENVRRLA